VWLLIHSIYRLEKTGLEKIPERGPAVLICNHVSFGDALIIRRLPAADSFCHGSQDIPRSVLNFVFRTSKAIPIAPRGENAQLLEKAYDDIAAALASGALIALFPEGRITDTGELYPFRSGIKSIVDRTPVP
jgi:1-acyl-sn-glycerol-3-phosphate acyltransferase